MKALFGICDMVLTDAEKKRRKDGVGPPCEIRFERKMRNPKSQIKSFKRWCDPHFFLSFFLLCLLNLQ